MGESKRESEDMPRLLTTREVAELTRLHVKTVRKRAARGLGPRYVRVAGRLLFPADAVRKFMAGGE